MPLPGHLPRLVLAGAAAVAAAALGGCTAVSGGYVPPVIVTVTPTVTITPKGAQPPASGGASPTPARTDITSDVAGAAHDLGRIVGIEDRGGTTVIAIDRYQRSGVRAAALARDGITLAPHTEEIYTNTSPQTYSVPVLPDATLTKQTCTTPDASAQTAPTTLAEMKGMSGREGIVYFDLDERGWVKSATTDPVCL